MSNRTFKEIAKEIKADWKNPYFGAEPYLQAMLSIDSSDPDTAYYADDAKTVVIYFLANAQTWRGEVARRVKVELKKMCNIK